ncbi:MAG: 30S ribosomal protein S5 [Patescibacteria group bacterium]
MRQQFKQQNNSGRGDRRPRQPREKSEYDSKVLDIARVTRVTKGGKRFSFRATVAIGDGKGKVGVGTAQGRDVAQSVAKATHQAKKDLIIVSLTKGTIPHEIAEKYSSAVVLLKPAPPGSGVKAGGPVRVVAKLAGIENITAKLIERTGNKINIARATIEALRKLKVKNQHATTSIKADN